MHTSKSTPPPPPKIQQALIPVILKLKDAYTYWQMCLSHFPKSNRYTLGSKIDEIILLAIEYTLIASYSEATQKIILIDRALSRNDLIKLLLLISWETKSLDTKKYTHLSEYFEEVGRMLGAWKRHLIQKTSDQNSQKNKT